MSKTQATREMERREAERREAASAAVAEAAVAEEQRAMVVEIAAPALAVAPAPAAVPVSAPAEGSWINRQGDLPSEAGRVNGTVKAMKPGAAVKRRGSTGGTIESSSARGARREHHLRSAVSSVTADTVRAYAEAPLASPPGGGGGSRPKGRVATIAARFGNWGRGGDAANAGAVGRAGIGGGGGGAGAAYVAGGGGGSGGSGGSAADRGAPASAPAGGEVGGGGDGRAEYGGDGVERRKVLDGLQFGNVRQKANAWGVPLRS